MLTVLALTTASLALGGCSLLVGAPNATTTPSASPRADVFTVKVGDCLNDHAGNGQVSTVPLIDCAEPHDSEAYASITMKDAAFPGADAVKTASDAGCEAQFNTFVGVNYAASRLSFSYYYPTTETWSQGDREILCLIFDPVGRTTGTLKAAAR